MQAGKDSHSIYKYMSRAGICQGFFIEILLIISNTVHHGLVNAPKDWQYSSFHRYVEEGIYDQMWGVSEKLIFDSDIGME